MGTSNGRSPDAAFKAPVKAALGIAMDSLPVLVEKGIDAYADTLTGHANVHHKLALELLDAIARTVRETPQRYT